MPPNYSPPFHGGNYGRSEARELLMYHDGLILSCKSSRVEIKLKLQCLINGSISERHLLEFTSIKLLLRGNSHIEAYYLQVDISLLVHALQCLWPVIKLSEKK